MKTLRSTNRNAEFQLLARLRLWFHFRVYAPLADPPHNGSPAYIRAKHTKDGVVFGIEPQISSLSKLLMRGDLETFLHRLSDIAYALFSGPLHGKALFVPELDELSLRANLTMPANEQELTGNRLIVHVATTVYTTGGHTRVIEDIAAALPEYRHIIILTATEPDSTDDTLKSLQPRFERLGIEVCSLESFRWEDKARELASRIADLQPRAVMLMAHPNDSVAYASVSGDSAPMVFYIHHTDHKPSLGASRLDYTHVDLTPACHRICASHTGLRASVVDMTVEDCGILPLLSEGPISGATCGSAYKYQGGSEFSYAQLIAALFASGVQALHHIGDMPENQKDHILGEITATGQDPARLIFHPNTPSLTAKLFELSPDFYLVSHPMGSGKATIEALSVGLPIVFPRPASTPELLNPDMTFRNSILISKLEQVDAAIRHLRSYKGVLGSDSRAVYQGRYSRSAFRKNLLSMMKGR